MGMELKDKLKRDAVILFLESEAFVMENLLKEVKECKDQQSVRECAVSIDRCADITKFLAVWLRM